MSARSSFDNTNTAAASATSTEPSLLDLSEEDNVHNKYIPPTTTTKDSVKDDFPIEDDEFPIEVEFPAPNEDDEFPVPTTDDEFPVPSDDDFPAPNEDDDFPVPKEDADEFGGNQSLDDGFDDFDDDFVDANNNNNDDDDDFGDFDDFEQTPSPVNEGPKTPTDAELYCDILETEPEALDQFMLAYLNRMWGNWENGEETVIQSPVEITNQDILNTPCSRDLWSKLSRDTVFYNPVTGAIGQFQWTRSETNKSYLNALGVTISSATAIESPTTTKRVNGHSPNSISSLPTSPILATATTQHKRSISQQLSPSSHQAGKLKVSTAQLNTTAITKEKEIVDQDLELDIDIARAYCELTEETIRIFPNVKLNAMVNELSRLLKQSADYLDSLLDQREQLKMDAETYNDLISCIVGHAQRLHVQSKDGSPAMVSKTKKNSSRANSTGFSNMMRRKTTTTSSTSMGGGVVGVKTNNNSNGPPPKRTMSSNSQIHALADNSRRSM